jgi:hypothetical protein
MITGMYGGLLNVRRQRGGTRWTPHAWGVEIDIDPENNQLLWGPDRFKMLLLLSPSLRQSQELFRKLLHAYGAVANKPPSLQESSLRLELPNGSAASSACPAKRRRFAASPVSLS